MHARTQARARSRDPAAAHAARAYTALRRQSSIASSSELLPESSPSLTSRNLLRFRTPPEASAPRRPASFSRACPTRHRVSAQGEAQVAAPFQGAQATCFVDAGAGIALRIKMRRPERASGGRGHGVRNGPRRGTSRSSRTRSSRSCCSSFSSFSRAATCCRASSSCAGGNAGQTASNLRTRRFFI